MSWIIYSLFVYNLRHKEERNLMRRQIIYVEDPTVKKKDTQSKQKPPAPLPRSTPNMDRPPRAGR